MTRWFGTPLALSIAAHAGAVVVIIFGAAWFLGAPSTLTPSALYVDLVQPVVATSDRPDATAGSTPDAATARRRTGVATRHPRPEPGVAASSETSTVPASPAIRVDSQVADTSGPLPATSDVPRPPVVPRAPDVRAESPRSGPRGTESAALVPRPAAPSPAMQSVLATPVPPAPGPGGPPSDAATSASRAFAAAVPPVTTSSDLGAAGHSTASGPATTGSPGAQGSAGSEMSDAGTRGGPVRGDALSAAGGGQPAAGDGGVIARLSPGDGQQGDGPAGAIPPEYESYVRALRQRVQERLVYPWAAVRLGQQGVVELEVRLGADGRLVAVEVVAGVSADALRGAAVSAVRSSAPFPFPPGLTARPLVVRLPVEFRLR